MSMKKELLKIVKKLRSEKSIDLKETPPVFKWSYEEEPNIVFQLLILETAQGNLSLNTPIH